MPTRPYVICHMVPSVDGRIVTRAWRLPRGLLAEYERTASSFDADAWIIGRVSMEPYAGNAALPARAGRARIPRTDFVARSDAPSYAIAIDPSGKLRWESASIDEEHAVTVLTEQVSDRYRRRRRRDAVALRCEEGFGAGPAPGAAVRGAPSRRPAVGQVQGAIWATVVAPDLPAARREAKGS